MNDTPKTDAAPFPAITPEQQHEHEQTLARLRRRIVANEVREKRDPSTPILERFKRTTPLAVHFTQDDVDVLNRTSRCHICGAGFFLSPSGYRIDEQPHDRQKHRGWVDDEVKRYAERGGNPTHIGDIAQREAIDLRARRASRDYGDDSDDA